MTSSAHKLTPYRKKRLQAKARGCDLCGKHPPFCWQCCSCGFSICQECMYENAWTMTCNGITWLCPDCGRLNGLGNQ